MNKYKSNENQVKSDKVELSSTDDKIVRSSSKSEHNVKSKNGNLFKYLKIKLH